MVTGSVELAGIFSKTAGLPDVHDKKISGSRTELNNFAFILIEFNAVAYFVTRCSAFPFLYESFVCRLEWHRCLYAENVI